MAILDKTKSTNLSAETARNLAKVLQEALEELRVSSRLEDFYVNFSLGEAISQRLSIIGTEDGGAEQLTARGLRTKFARISYVEDSVEDAVTALKQLPLDIEVVSS